MVLPAPFGPSSATRSPRPIRSDTSRSAGEPSGYANDSPATSSAATLRRRPAHRSTAPAASTSPAATGSANAAAQARGAATGPPVAGMVPV